jgi:hypothetical protein
MPPPFKVKNYDEFIQTVDPYVHPSVIYKLPTALKRRCSTRERVRLPPLAMPTLLSHAGIDLIIAVL